MTTIRPTPSRDRFARTFIALCCVLAAPLAPRPAAAQSTWSGGGMNNLFTESDNWDVLPSNNGSDVLIFTGSTRPTPSVNVPWSLDSVTFDAGATVPFTINGNDITLLGTAAITNNSSETHLINTNLISNTASGLNITSATGGVTITGTVQLTGGGTVTLTVDGAADTTLSGVISGSGADLDALVKNGAGVLTLGGANTFDGPTTVNAGTLAIGADNALAGPLLINGGAALQASGQNRTLGSVLTIASDLGFVGTNDLTLTGAVDLTADRAVTVSDTGDLTLAGAVTESGGARVLTKNGTGRLVLDSANAYTGGTVLNAGTLALGDDTALGAGPLSINGGALEARGGARVIANPITVNTDLEITGGQDLEITDNMVLSANRVVTVTNSGNTLFSGDLGGAGSMTKDGPGSLELTGLNTYGGDTVVDDGTLTISSGGQIASNATINGGTMTLNTAAAVMGATTLNGGTLAFGDDNPLAAGLSIAGGAIRAAGGARTIPNTLAVNISGDFAVSGSEDLTLSSPLTLTADRTINVTSAGDTVLAGVIDDASAGRGLTKAGAGTLTLAAANTYTGDTRVDAGTLIVSGAVAGSTTVNNLAAVLGGGGAFGGNVAVNQGVINAGAANAVGTMTISGNLSLTANTALVVDVASPTSADFYSVGGSVTLDGGLFVNQLPGYTDPSNDTFTIITAGGGITGQFASVDLVVPAAFTVAFEVVGNSGVLAVAPVPYTQIAISGNGRGVAASLEAVRSTATGDMAVVIGELNQLGAGPFRHAMDQLVPEEIGAMSTVTINAAKAQATHVTNRLAEVRQGVRGASTRNLQLASASNDPQDDLAFLAMASKPGTPAGGIFSASPHNPWGVFVAGSGTFGDVDSTSQQAGYDFQTSDLSIGFDHRLDPYTLVGATLGYARSNIDVASNGGEVDVDSVRFGAYGTYYRDGIHLDAMIGGGYHQYDSDRRVRFGGINRTATSSPDGLEFNAMLGAGIDFDIKKLVVSPIASIRYTAVTVEQYTESGAGALNLKVDQQSVNSFLVQAGVRVSTAVRYTLFSVIPEFRVSWQHEAQDQGTSGTARFASGAAGSFGFDTTDIGDNAAVIGAGVTVLFNNRASAFVDYETEMGRRDYAAHTIKTGVQIPF